MPASFEVRPLTVESEARECARLMAGSEPWITLRRDAEDAFRPLCDPMKEVYVAWAARARAGFVILDMHGVTAGYVQTICIARALRNQGLGTQLLKWTEERIFRDSPNVFLCVSSFNVDAQRLYARLGYVVAGRLTDFLIAGHDEILMRKTRGPRNGYVRRVIA